MFPIVFDQARARVDHGDLLSLFPFRGVGHYTETGHRLVAEKCSVSRAIMRHSTEDRFFLLWLCSAALVTVLRFLHAASPGYDLGIQIAAAYNLLAGNGLSTYQHIGPNLAQPASLITLTHFPSGYSLAAAALIALNLSVAMVVKVLGGAGTMLGWWGWGRLAGPFFNEGLKRGSGWKWAGFAIATSTPLLFTPWWGGTDIFLWAAVPWVCITWSEPQMRRCHLVCGLMG